MRRSGCNDCDRLSSFAEQLASFVNDNNYTLAQKILRGVAQAQDEFNDNGLNGRLLESGICLQDVQFNKSSDFL
ncbi:hypothetical protein [Nostoc sp. UHCC 0251]|uniref:hypothetical protein n=1 Tax=Nostoc sp. UHCC 0251 TaxID=3110240 RepID=UPI002B20B912|nr:hypothetical protein [Nostoc sp. UHCC 0251]MEA5622780.1 hypothetical protein [Nostoc sp. UHCC 0251]